MISRQRLFDYIYHHYMNGRSTDKIDHDNHDYSKRQHIQSSIHAYNVIKEAYTDCMQHHEECWVMYLNRANKLLGVTCISKGGISSTVVDIRMIIQTALLSHATGIILSHNHPSGNKNLSDADLDFTKRVKEACNMFDISLVDHIVLTDSGYNSYCDQNI